MRCRTLPRLVLAFRCDGWYSTSRENSSNEAQPWREGLLDVRCILLAQCSVTCLASAPPPPPPHHTTDQPENILVMDAGVMHSGKLADFGFALRLDPSPSPMIAVGTPEYIAPEVLLQQPFDGRADVWSAGVTAFCLLSGALPFRGLTLDKLYTAVLDGACSYAGSEWRGISAPAQDLVRRMLVVDPSQRWTAGELLEHPWLTGTTGMVTTLGLGRRGRVRLKALVLAVVFVQRLRRGLGRPWPSQQELGSP